MNEIEIAKSLASFGGVGVLALVMWLSSKAATVERQQITAQFLAFQEKAAGGQAQLVREVMASLGANTDALHRFTDQNTAEHRAVLAAIEKLTDRIEQISKS